MTNADLFADSTHQPLAARMRPTSLDDYVGQQHILAKGKPLRSAIEQGRIHSLILWGPPGTGKTTLAELIALYIDAHVERLSAVTSGVKDIRKAIDAAKDVAMQSGRRTLLFVDEVHRFNKSQQDAFLPYIEDGTVIFVGATTENPSFELNRALLSRARIYLLKKHTYDDLSGLMANVQSKPEQSMEAASLVYDETVQSALIKIANGDGRNLLNQLEILADMIEPNEQGQRIVEQSHLSSLFDYVPATGDKGGDAFYDMISAFHKSVRGSSPDGALYWFARMLAAGMDPLYVARRLLAIASEDIGNADPRAMQLAINAWDTFTRVGPAEGERAIAQAAVFMACAPKSNAVYTAFKAAKADVRENPDFDVPVHLRNAPTSLMKDLGYGAEYRYAHNESNAYAAGQTYFPEELGERAYYHPTDRGLEKQITDKLAFLKSLDNNHI
ncbi:replication-associated recombination protein A [Catenovulum sp. SM1970]|uniref:replication-associated recombination protein A n=1 Tax=Marinifaba aquimaris TaxID=2741323 RepID=UPI001572F15C|nr:replication-associated recombination protein A [Marinifaba aquimaris]NTS75246.1 replication-associated recombination protein A [Marinifaba aquimaris]